MLNRYLFPVVCATTILACAAPPQVPPDAGACSADADCGADGRCAPYLSGDVLVFACITEQECPADPVWANCPSGAAWTTCSAHGQTEDVCAVPAGILATACPPMCGDPNGVPTLCAISPEGTTCCRDGVCQ